MGEQRQYLSVFPLVSLMSSILFGGAWFWGILPLAGLVLAERGVPAWEIGLIGAVPWLFIVVTIPLVPGSARWVAPMRLYRLATWGMLVSALIFVMTSNLWLWVFAYILCGIGTAVRWIMTDAFIATLPPPKTRERWFSAYMWLGNFIIVFGPLVVVGFGTGQAAFWVGVWLVAIALLQSYFVHVTDDHMGQKIEERGFHLLVAVARQVPYALIAVGVSGAVEGIAGKILPVQAYGLGFGESISAFAVSIFGAGNFVSQLLFGVFRRRFSARAMLIPIFLSIVVSALSIPFTSIWWGYYCASIFAVGGLAGIVYTIVAISVTAGCSPAEGLRMMACLGLSYTIGSIIGSALAGGATSLNLLWGMPLVIAGTSFAAVIALKKLSRREASC